MPCTIGRSVCSTRCGLPEKSIKWPDLAALVLQVETVVFIGLHDVRNTPVDLDAVLGQLFNLFGVVGD